MNFTNLINFTNTRRAVMFSVFIIVLFIAFSSPLSPPPSGWYQQFMPDLNGKSIYDITFIDSLTGYAVATQTSDSSYILKTTNGGNNWLIIHRQLYAMNELQFLNFSTGYAEGGYLYKTTDGGFNWIQMNTLGISVANMSILNEDTIWVTGCNGFYDAILRTTNGGSSWQEQLTWGSLQNTNIYMYNSRIGFACLDFPPNIWKTTNSGLNWTLNVSGERFNKIYFIDSLTGWRTFDSIKYTSDGGLNWQRQLMPYGGMIHTSIIVDFYNVNRDTIWGIGGSILYPNNQVRATLYRSTNNGTNWLFQIPDTSFGFPIFYFIRFSNQRNGWAYFINSGIHTTTGGNDSFYTGLQQISSETPVHYKLYQNYPNPFNPRTVIPYSLSASAHVKIIAYDITGREVQRMVDNYQQAGAYEVDFMGKFTASGVYFYRMTVDDKVVGTRKMILIK